MQPTMSAMSEAGKREEGLRDMGCRIVRLREEKGWSQVELAGRLGVARSRLGKWERGQNAPSFAELPGLADALGVDLEELIRGRGLVQKAPISPAQRRELRLCWMQMTRLLRPVADLPERRPGGRR